MLGTVQEWHQRGGCRGRGRREWSGQSALGRWHCPASRKKGSGRAGVKGHHERRVVRLGEQWPQVQLTRKTLRERKCLSGEECPRRPFHELPLAYLNGPRQTAPGLCHMGYLHSSLHISYHFHHFRWGRRLSERSVNSQSLQTDWV